MRHLAIAAFLSLLTAQTNAGFIEIATTPEQEVVSFRKLVAPLLEKINLSSDENKLGLAIASARVISSPACMEHTKASAEAFEKLGMRMKDIILTATFDYDSEPPTPYKASSLLQYGAMMTMGIKCETAIRLYMTTQ